MKHILLFFTVFIATIPCLKADGSYWDKAAPAAAVADTTLNPFCNVNLSTTPIQVKSGPTEIWSWYFYNNAAAGSERSVKLFNTLNAPTVGTTVPTMTITVAGRSPATYTGAKALVFSNGLWIAATTASGYTANVSPLSGEVSANLMFK